MKHNNDTCYTIPEFNIAIDNELKRWLEIFATNHNYDTTTSTIRDRFDNSVSSSFRNLQLDRRFYKLFILVSFDEL